MFLGTPHRGSDKATYGKVLANVAQVVTHRPPARPSVALGIAGRAIDENCQHGCKRKSDLKVRRCKSFSLVTMMKVSVGNKVRPIGASPESSLWHTLFKKPSKNQDLSQGAQRSYAVEAMPTASPRECRVERVSPSILRYWPPLSQI
jgi:hypothetical protein